MFGFLSRRCYWRAGCIVAGMAFWPLGALAADLLSHRAEYEVSLHQSRPVLLGTPRHIVDAPGVMQIEFADVCEGWNISQHLNVALREANGGGVVSDNAFTGWEAKDGSSYRFESRVVLNNHTSQQFSGEATLSDGGNTVVEYIYPRGDTLDMPPGVLFPVGHLVSLIDKARRGEKVTSQFVFDGATKEGIFEVNSVIGKAIIDPSTHDILPDTISGMRHWPIHMAFFQPNDQTPQYEVSLHLSENGVARNLIFDYGDFSIKASLRDFQILNIQC